MNKPRGIQLAILTLVMGMTLPLSDAGTETLTAGKLIFAEGASGQPIFEADLKTRHRKAVPGLEATCTEEATCTVYSQLSKIDADRFLFDKESIVYAKSVEYSIYEYNRRTREIKYIRPGQLPTYIPEHGKFFFYDKSKNPAIKGSRIQIADLKDPLKSERELGERPIFNQPVIQIGPDEIIFANEEDGHRKDVWHYNLVKDKLELLTLKVDCKPQIWRSATRQLLCYNSREQRYYLTDLAGEHIEDIGKPGDYAISYIPEFDALLYSDTRMGWGKAFMAEVNDPWVYYFKNGKKTKLLKDALISAALWYVDEERTKGGQVLQ